MFDGNRNSACCRSERPLLGTESSSLEVSFGSGTALRSRSARTSSFERRIRRGVGQLWVGNCPWQPIRSNVKFRASHSARRRSAVGRKTSSTDEGAGRVRFQASRWLGAIRSRPVRPPRHSGARLRGDPLVPRLAPKHEAACGMLRADVSPAGASRKSSAMACACWPICSCNRR